nr:MAG TPA: hypothetical protein [Caudoviricetes sp.]
MMDINRRLLSNRSLLWIMFDGMNIVHYRLYSFFMYLAKLPRFLF